MIFINSNRSHYPTFLHLGINFLDFQIFENVKWQQIADQYLTIDKSERKELEMRFIVISSVILGTSIVILVMLVAISVATTVWF